MLHGQLLPQGPSVKTLGALSLKDALSAHGACKALREIPLEEFLPPVLESSYTESQRWAWLLQKGCNREPYWPLHVLRVLMNTVRLNYRGDDSHRRTLLWHASANSVPI